MCGVNLILTRQTIGIERNRATCPAPLVAIHLQVSIDSAVIRELFSVKCTGSVALKIDIFVRVCASKTSFDVNDLANSERTDHFGRTLLDLVIEAECNGRIVHSGSQL